MLCCYFPVFIIIACKIINASYEFIFVPFMQVFHCTEFCSRLDFSDWYKGYLVRHKGFEVRLYFTCFVRFYAKKKQFCFLVLVYFRAVKESKSDQLVQPSHSVLVQWDSTRLVRWKGFDLKLVLKYEEKRGLCKTDQREKNCCASRSKALMKIWPEILD